MENMLGLLKTTVKAHRSFIIYGLISVFVTVIDVAVSRLSEFAFDPVTANTMGVVTGFIVQYFLTARHVYNTKNLRSFAVFFGTFLIGLVLANGIVYVCRSYLFGGSDSGMAFLVSKGASIVIPFFFTYFLRKKLMPTNGGEGK